MHSAPRSRQEEQIGCASSHFFLRFLHSKQPSRERLPTAEAGCVGELFSDIVNCDALSSRLRLALPFFSQRSSYDADLVVSMMAHLRLLKFCELAYGMSQARPD